MGIHNCLLMETIIIFSIICTKIIIQVTTYGIYSSRSKALKMKTNPKMVINQRKEKQFSNVYNDLPASTFINVCSANKALCILRFKSALCADRVRVAQRERVLLLKISLVKSEVFCERNK